MTTKKKTPTGSKTVHFSVTGEAITRIARDMWVSRLPKNALELLIEGIPGIKPKQALNILTGKSKLVGKNEVELVKDNTKYYDPETKGTPLNTPKKLTLLMEEELIESQMNYLFILSDRYRNYLTRQGDFSRVNIVESAQGHGEKVKKIMEQLITLYPHVDKEYKDLPIFNYKLINDLTIEREKYYKQEEDDREQRQYEFEQKKDAGILEEELKRKRQIAIDNTLAKRFANAGSGIPGIPDINVEDFVRKRIKEDNRKNVDPEDASKTEWTSGYICPKGKFYGCSDIGHLGFADDLRSDKIFTSKIDDSQQALDELGWMKISMNRVFWIPDIDSHIEITKKQIDTLFDYINGKKLKKFSYNGDMMTFPKFLKEIKI